MSSESPALLPAPYDEETIVTQLTSIYTLLHKLSYYCPGDVVFPPAGGHTINEELCYELLLTPEVVSLIKKIPYTVGGYEKPPLLQSRAYEYLNDDDIRNGRDPENTGTSEPLRMDFLKPWEIALTCWVQMDDGFSVILNIKSNIIQIIDGSNYGDENDFRASEESKAYHAPTYLPGIIDDIFNLQYIYTTDGNIIHPESPEQIQIRRILTGEYGWGSDFREEDWRREGEDTCQRISDVQMEMWEV
ncbi:hypothetical protein N7478_012843 [Penicillium angulare]|uniref:uncharacterized protein n=1 Tax=Penicillium angulare TaxID=116970 RepID=UPI00254068BE|nr:uncharacterized protein N7478_012843 [Penicillium angulare]KAJ5256739.1 hypothetical protein N7478_012843 [Penicillium angulare]